MHTLDLNVSIGSKRCYNFIDFVYYCCYYYFSHYLLFIYMYNKYIFINMCIYADFFCFMQFLLSISVRFEFWIPRINKYFIHVFIHSFNLPILLKNGTAQWVQQVAYKKKKKKKEHRLRKINDTATYSKAKVFYIVSDTENWKLYIFSVFTSRNSICWGHWLDFVKHT